jgi:flagellar basal-body rod protein FlgC
MADIKNVFDIAARSMSAQMVRLNTVASNLANSRSVASSEAEAYRAIKPVFKTIYADDLQKSGVASVDVVDIVSVDRAPDKSYQPGHPKADKDGDIYPAAGDREAAMVEVLEASRQYENNVEVISTLRGLMMRTINMGK